jgi:MFS family permease
MYHSMQDYLTARLGGLLIGAAMGAIWAWVTSTMAGRKNRPKKQWGIAGFFLGPFPLLGLAFLPALCPRCAEPLSDDQRKGGRCPKCFGLTDSELKALQESEIRRVETVAQECAKKKHDELVSIDTDLANLQTIVRRRTYLCILGAISAGVLAALITVFFNSRAMFFAGLVGGGFGFGLVKAALWVLPGHREKSKRLWRLKRRQEQLWGNLPTEQGTGEFGTTHEK